MDRQLILFLGFFCLKTEEEGNFQCEDSTLENELAAP